MGNKVNLIRPDGSQISVDESQAGSLRTLGYKDQTVEQQAGEAVAKSTEDFYSTTGQKLKTAGEGLLGGASLGLSDLAFDSLGFDTAERAQYNPGIRLGTELVGGLAGLTPLGSLTPAGLLSKGAKAVGGAVAEGKVAQTAITAAVEGGGFGTGSALTNSVITGDPLTTESVVAGLGWGTIWGGGLGLVAGKAGAVLEGRAARAAALEEAQAISVKSAGEGWQTFRSSISDATSELQKATKTADSMVKNVAETMKSATAIKDGFWAEQRLAASEMVNRPRGAASFAELEGANIINGEAKAASRAYGEARAAAKAGDFEKMQDALGRFKGHTDTVAKYLGVQAPEVAGFAALDAKTAARAAEGVASLGAAEPHLKNLAVTPKEFARMSPGRAEKTFGAVDTVLSSSKPELVGIQESVKTGIQKMQDALGIKIEGPPAQQLRGVWEAMKHQTTASAEREVAHAASGALPWIKRAASRAVGSAAASHAGHLGAGRLVRAEAYEGGKHALMAILGLKAAVVGGLSKAAMTWAPRGAKALTVAGPRLEPLKMRLDGTEDKGKVTRAELMQQRSKEIREAAGSVSDTLYKAVSPLAEYHPELAQSIHKLGISQFKFLLDRLPRDPGLAFNRLQTLWKADPVQTEQFARYYEVFQNPVAVVNNVLKTGRVTPQAAEGLREMHPALFAQLRVDMLERLSDPKVMAKLSYNEQVSLGTLLQIPLHSTMTPQFVATQQQMYMEKNVPIPMPPQPGPQSNGGGRPAGGNSSATSAQKITEH